MSAKVQRFGYPFTFQFRQTQFLYLICFLHLEAFVNFVDKIMENPISLGNMQNKPLDVWKYSGNV